MVDVVRGQVGGKEQLCEGIVASRAGYKAGGQLDEQGVMSEMVYPTGGHTAYRVMVQEQVAPALVPAQYLCMSKQHVGRAARHKLCVNIPVPPLQLSPIPPFLPPLPLPGSPPTLAYQGSMGAAQSR